MRSEAKVNLRGYVTNMSNLRSMLKGSGTQQPQKAFLQIMKYPPGVAEHAHPDGFPRAPAAAPRNTAAGWRTMSPPYHNLIMSLFSLSSLFNVTIIDYLVDSLI